MGEESATKEEKTKSPFSFLLEIWDGFVNLIKNLFNFGGGDGHNQVAKANGTRQPESSKGNDTGGGQEKTDLSALSGSNKKIILDIGHGVVYHDGERHAGAKYAGVKESDVVAGIGQKLQKILKGYGVDAIFSRGDDNRMMTLPSLIQEGQ